MTDVDEVRNGTCEWCGDPFVQAAIGRRRLFCQPAHRVAMHRWSKAFQALQVGLDGQGRCYCCARRGPMRAGPQGAPLCPLCCDCDPDAGVMMPPPRKGDLGYVDWRGASRQVSQCVTDTWAYYARPSGLGWAKAKPYTRRQSVTDAGGRRQA